MRILRQSRGFSIIELLVTVGVYGILLAVAMPHIQSYRLQSGLSAGQQAVQTTLLRARWLAINKGQQQYVVLNGSNVLEIHSLTAAGTLASSTNLSNYSVTVDSFTAFPFDVRGFPTSTQTLTVRQPDLPATRTVTVGAYGKVTVQ